MNKKNDKWINDIRSRMENYSEPLPADLWEKIDSEINRPKVIPMWRKWTSVAAAAAVVIAVSTLSVFYWTSDPSLKNTTIPVADNTKSDRIEQENIIQNIPADNSVVADVETGNVMPQLPVESIEADKQQDSSEEKMPELLISDNKSAIEENKDKTETTEAKENISSSKEKRINMMKVDRETVRRNASYLAMADEGGTKKRRNVQVGIMAGNVPYSSSSSFGGMSRLAMSTKSLSSVNNIVVGEMSDATASYSQMLFNNMAKDTYTDIKHHVPVTVGASVKWNLNKDWALETGLNYTYLYSELRSGAKSYIEDKQKLHYVGIPLKVQRSVWGNDIFSFYASAGGMMEKCVSGSVETVCVDESNRRIYETEDLNVKPLQFSVLASVGLQANFNKLLSLYLEPGMIYYFDDNTDILTIRKDKPFNFNLQLGIRFNLNNK